MILSSGRQAADLIDVFRGATSRVVALSSCDVYRACGVLHGSEPGPLEPLPITESSPLRATLQTYPPETIQLLQNVFGWLDDEYDKKDDDDDRPQHRPRPVQGTHVAVGRGHGADLVLLDREQQDRHDHVLQRP